MSGSCGGSSVFMADMVANGLCGGGGCPVPVRVAEVMDDSKVVSSVDVTGFLINWSIRASS